METDFEELYNAYYMQVYSYLVALSKNKELSEEITQKAFFKAFTSSKKYRGEASEFTWLCTIAKNLYIDELRARKRIEIGAETGVSTSTLNQTDFDITPSLVDEDSAFRIHQVLHALEEPYKEIFQLRVFGELSFAKIGMIFGKSENWARVTYHRARLKIQEKMERMEEK